VETIKRQTSAVYVWLFIVGQSPVALGLAYSL